MAARDGYSCNDLLKKTLCPQRIILGLHSGFGHHLYSYAGGNMSIITTFGAIAIFFVVIGFALLMIKDLFKSK